jgi:hypothetical protein
MDPSHHVNMNDVDILEVRHAFHSLFKSLHETGPRVMPYDDTSGRDVSFHLDGRLSAKVGDGKIEPTSMAAAEYANENSICLSS